MIKIYFCTMCIVLSFSALASDPHDYMDDGEELFKLLAGVPTTTVKNHIVKRVGRLTCAKSIASGAVSCVLRYDPLVEVSMIDKDIYNAFNVVADVYRNTVTGEVHKLKKAEGGLKCERYMQPIPGYSCDLTRSVDY